MKKAKEIKVLKEQLEDCKTANKMVLDLLNESYKELKEAKKKVEELITFCDHNYDTIERLESNQKKDFEKLINTDPNKPKKETEKNLSPPCVTLRLFIG